MQKLKLSIDDTCDATGESREQVYKAIQEGHLKSFLVGRRRFITPADAQAWVAFLKRESDAGRPVMYQARAKASV